MSRTENVELAVVCLLEDGGRVLLQNRKKEDWHGWALPGGHVEPGESFVDAAIREMQEETGLTIRNPRLVGVKQFPIEAGRYVVLLPFYIFNNFWNCIFKIYIFNNIYAFSSFHFISIKF